MINNIKFLQFISLIFFMATILSGFHTYKNIKEQGEQYKANINHLQFDVAEAKEMFTDIKNKNKVDNKFVNISAAKFSMYTVHVDLGRCSDTELLTSLVSVMNALSLSENLKDIDGILLKIETLLNNIQNLKTKNGESDFKWYFGIK